MIVGKPKLANTLERTSLNALQTLVPRTQKANYKPKSVQSSMYIYISWFKSIHNDLHEVKKLFVYINTKATFTLLKC